MPEMPAVKAFGELAEPAQRCPELSVRWSRGPSGVSDVTGEGRGLGRGPGDEPATSGAPFQLPEAVAAIYGRAVRRYSAAEGELLSIALLEEEAGQRLRNEPVKPSRPRDSSPCSVSRTRQIGNACSARILLTMATPRLRLLLLPGPAICFRDGTSCLLGRLGGQRQRGLPQPGPPERARRSRRGAVACCRGQRGRGGRKPFLQSPSRW